MPELASPAMESPATTSTAERQQRHEVDGQRGRGEQGAVAWHLGEQRRRGRVPGCGAMLVAARKIAAVSGSATRMASEIQVRGRRTSTDSSTPDHANTLALVMREEDVLQ